jgi:hypothetical protein
MASGNKMWYAYIRGQYVGNSYGKTKREAIDRSGRMGKEPGIVWRSRRKEKNPVVQLPKQWTNAQVRVNPQGKVQVKIAANKVSGAEYWMRRSEEPGLTPSQRATMRMQAMRMGAKIGMKSPTKRRRKR